MEFGVLGVEVGVLGVKFGVLRVLRVLRVEVLEVPELADRKGLNCPTFDWLFRLLFVSSLAIVH